jgi:hypothetical protein
MGVGELPDQPGLADTGLPDDGHDLAVAGRGPAQHLPELLEFAVASHEPGQSPKGRGVQAGPKRASAR